MDENGYIVSEIESLKAKLFDYLCKQKVTVPDKKFSTLIDALEQIQTIIPGEVNINWVLNSAGYVIDYEYVDSVTKNQPVPEDIRKGYYKLDEFGNLEVDELKRYRFWRDE